MHNTLQCVIHCHTILLLCGFKWTWFKFNILKVGLLVQLKLRWLKLKKLVAGASLSPVPQLAHRSVALAVAHVVGGLAVGQHLHWLALASSSKL